MKNFRKIFPVLVLLGCASACVRVNITPVAPDPGFQQVCIEQNTTVLVSDLVQVIQEGFKRHGIASKIYTAGSKPAGCEYVMTYTALRSRELPPTMIYAKFHLFKNGDPAGFAEWHLKAGLDRWKSTASKLDSVIDELLKDFK